MLTQRKFRRTVIQVVVLTEGNDNYDPETLHTIADDITDGDAVGTFAVVESQVVNGKEMADLLSKAGSEPGFFQLDDEGNDVE